MLITKIESIANLAVFDNFSWDKSVLDKDKKIQNFEKVNIFYGRNYSGKTTLSRIFRAMELGCISDKYDAPRFSILLADNSKIDQGNLTSHGKIIRVFNEDFIRENLRFFNDSNENIEPFAILGSANNLLEQEIATIQMEIGSEEVGVETGLQLQRLELRKKYEAEKTKLKNEEDWLDEKLTKKATDKKEGIKYQFEKFGDQNYTKAKLENDISKIYGETYQSLKGAEKQDKEALIREAQKLHISASPAVPLTFQKLAQKTAQLMTQTIVAADKIENLINNPKLNQWVDTGRTLHADKHTDCAFCGNTITPARWAALGKHFDEASNALKVEIETTIAEISGEINKISSSAKIDKNLYYTQFHERLAIAVKNNEVAEKLYVDGLNKLKEDLDRRRANIWYAQDNYIIPNDSVPALEEARKKCEIVRAESNQFAEKLKEAQTTAKSLLRLSEVETFTHTIDYKAKKATVKEIENNVKKIIETGKEITQKIEEKKRTLADKKRQLNDEEKGAIKVNEYLNHYFGNQYLSLVAKQEGGDDATDKKIRFEVVRDGKKAFNLSEGECSLLAFCYFLAKLEDVATQGSKPVIWIDDPICSLDNNHIFFVFSLLFSEIITKDGYEQLFLSTHNLDFLKYLKKLEPKNIQIQPKPKEYSLGYFLIERSGPKAAIKSMPSYLRTHITEFNYLFHQIYKCATSSQIADENYADFYTFGNNARKFLEILLFYKYPDTGKEGEKYRKFFGEGNIPSMLVSRVSNEYSHLAGGLERGALPVDIPEMHQVAKLILEKIKFHDKEQYTSFLNSIGEIDFIS